MGLIPYKNEVYLDWTEEKNVEAMRAALREVGSRLDRSYPAIIGGRRVETDGEIVSVNPADPSQVVGRTARATEREADMALETATSTFETWSRTSPEARARILLRASAIMKRRKFELLAWEAYGGGRPARRRPELPARLRLGGWGLSGRGRKDAFYLLYRLDEDGTQDKRAGGQADRESALGQAGHSRDGRQGRDGSR